MTASLIERKLMLKKILLRETRSYGIKNCLRFTIGSVNKISFFKIFKTQYLKMFKKILIIGCGMIGSSILRASISQKLCQKIYVFEKILCTKGR